MEMNGWLMRRTCSGGKTTVLGIYSSTMARYLRYLQGKAYIFEVVPTGHLFLELLLQLLTGADGLLVSGEVRQLFEPGIGEVL